MIQGNQNK